MKDKQYYIKLYEHKFDELCNQYKDEADPTYYATMEFEEKANKEEIVGYYLVTYPTAYLAQFIYNLYFNASYVSENDIDIVRILARL